MFQTYKTVYLQPNGIWGVISSYRAGANARVTYMKTRSDQVAAPIPIADATDEYFYYLPGFDCRPAPLGDGLGGKIMREAELLDEDTLIKKVAKRSSPGFDHP
jgi:hypothetical protein